MALTAPPTPVLLGDDPMAIYGLASDLLECAWSSIVDTVAITGSGITDADVPTSRAVHPRVPDFDDCCQTGGMLYAYAEEFYLTDGARAPFPAQSAQVIACPPPATAVTFVIGFARCVEVRAEGVKPTVDQALALRVLVVAWAIWRGLKCCLLEWSRERPRITATMGLMQIISDEGACTGYEVRVTARVPDGCSCG